jgi:signal transduction histidine kinase
VFIQCEDNGPGIPKATLERIFEPFYTTRGTGVGLGMPIVQGIVQRHGGKVEIESQVGEGTRVRLWVPRFEGE